VGANVGQYSLALAKTFGARISLRAFEPQRPVFHMLCGTMALNNCLNVKLECAVVSDQDGHQIRIVLPDYDAANNFGALEFEAVQASDNSLLRFSDKEDAVPTVTLDSYAERPHLIKIDAEGMEMKVLQGAARTVANARPVCMVETGKTGLEPVRSFFAGHNYKLFPRGQNAIAIPGELFANRDFLGAVGVPA
jgi:FkbM family methyltransferase